MKSILLGMSGGIDSAVAAARLLDEGYEVVPLYLAMTEESDSRERERRERICRRLGLSLVTKDLRALFLEEVFHPFLGTYRRGETPNPCIRCNERVKFKTLLAEMRSLGLDYLATGHYARIILREKRRRLARGHDIGKDQSYVLYRLDEDTRDHLLFPLGNSTKKEVVEEAFHRFGDLFEGVSESSDLCFLSSERRKDLMRSEPGPIVDLAGHELGRHQGLGLYTVGQRKGLGLAGGPWYVLKIDSERESLVVGRREDLTVRSVVAVLPFWHRKPLEGESLFAQHRYRTAARKITLDFIRDERFAVTYIEATPLPAPGQSLVLYEGDCILGGGIVEKQ